MSVRASIIDGPLTDALAGPAAAGVGARLRFDGIVRGLEGGRPLLALDYQTYDPMALHELANLARAVTAQHGLLALTALHSRGRVAVGEVSFILEVQSAHRAEALAALADFIDRMKRDVPIWKRPLWAP